jgi:hypothetical protein
VLSPLEAAGIWKDIWIAEAHYSTAIEGNTLVISEVEKLLDEGAPSAPSNSANTWR